MSQYHYIRFTYADRKANQFVELGGAGFVPELARREFDALPTIEGGDILVDYLDGDGLVDTRHVTWATVEAKLCRPFGVLLQQGRERLEERETDLRDALRARGLL